MKKRVLCRRIGAVVLAAAMFLTGIPAEALAAPTDIVTEEAVTEDNSASESDDSEVITPVEEGKEDFVADETEDDAEEVIPEDGSAEETDADGETGVAEEIDEDVIDDDVVDEEIIEDEIPEEEEFEIEETVLGEEEEFLATEAASQLTETLSLASGQDLKSDEYGYFWDGDTNTLYLNNADISSESGAAIAIDPGTLKTVTVKVEGDVVLSGASEAVSISGLTELTIEGKGTLSLVSNLTGDKSSAITGLGKLNVIRTALNVESAGNGLLLSTDDDFDGSVTSDASKISVSAANYAILSSGKIELTNASTLTVSSTDTQSTAISIGTLTAMNGSVINIDTAGRGIVANSITMNPSGTIKVINTGSTAIEVNGGDVTLSSGGSIYIEKANSYGLVINYGNLNITQGGLVHVSQLVSGSCGIYVSCGDITISSAVGITVGDKANGVCMEGIGVTVRGGDFNLVDGGAPSICATSYAIYMESTTYTYTNNINVSAGTINLFSQYDYAIYAPYASLNVSGKNTLLNVEATDTSYNNLLYLNKLVVEGGAKATLQSGRYSELANIRNIIIRGEDTKVISNAKLLSHNGINSCEFVVSDGAYLEVGGGLYLGYGYNGKVLNGAKVELLASQGGNTPLNVSSNASLFINNAEVNVYEPEGVSYTGSYMCYDYNSKIQLVGKDSLLSIEATNPDTKAMYLSSGASVDVSAGTLNLKSGGEIFYGYSSYGSKCTVTVRDGGTLNAVSNAAKGLAITGSPVVNVSNAAFYVSKNADNSDETVSSDTVFNLTNAVIEEPSSAYVSEDGKLLKNGYSVTGDISIVSDGTPGIVIETQPEKTLSTEVSKPVSVSVKASFINCSEEDLATVKYQWYTIEDKSKTPISGANSAEYAFVSDEIGIYELVCLISLGSKNSVWSDSSQVVVSPNASAGRKVRTEPLYFEYNAPSQSNEEEGWSWERIKVGENEERVKLVLDSVFFDVESGTALNISSQNNAPVDIEVKGNCYLITRGGGSCFYESNSVYDKPTTIYGDGKLFMRSTNPTNSATIAYFYTGSDITIDVPIDINTANGYAFYNGSSNCSTTFNKTVKFISDRSYGLYVYDAVTFNDDVYVKGDSCGAYIDGNLIINDTEAVFEAKSGTALYADGGLTAKNSSIEAKSDSSSSSILRMYSGDVLIDNSDIKVSGKYTSSDCAFSLNGYSILVKDSAITVDADLTENADQILIYMSSSDGVANFDNSTLNLCATGKRTEGLNMSSVSLNAVDSTFDIDCAGNALLCQGLITDNSVFNIVQKGDAYDCISAYGNIEFKNNSEINIDASASTTANSIVRSSKRIIFRESSINIKGNDLGVIAAEELRLIGTVIDKPADAVFTEGKLVNADGTPVGEVSVIPDKDAYVIIDGVKLTDDGEEIDTPVIRRGDNATLSVDYHTVNGNPSLSFEWYKYDYGTRTYSKITGATASEYRVPVSEVGRYLYKARIINGEKVSESDSFELEVIYENHEIFDLKTSGEYFEFSSDVSYDYYDEYGLKWDCETKTLTLSNAYIRSGLLTSPGVRVVVEDGTESYIRSEMNGILTSYTTGKRDITFSGCGRLIIESDSCAIGGFARVNFKAGFVLDAVVYDGFYKAYVISLANPANDETSGIEVNHAELNLKAFGEDAHALIGRVNLNGSEITYPADCTYSNTKYYDSNSKECAEIKIKPDSDPFLAFTSLPENALFMNENSIETLNAKVRAFGVSDKAEISYEWYKSSDWSKKNTKKVGDSEDLVPLNERGEQLYYVVAKVKDGNTELSVESELIAVYVMPEGRELVNKAFEVQYNTSSFGTDSDYFKKYGITWDMDTQTLTLDNTYIYSDRYNGLWVPYGTKIVMTDGSYNVVKGRDNGALQVSGGSKARTLEVSGKGTLLVENMNEQATSAVFNASNVSNMTTITGGAVVDVKTFSNDNAMYFGGSFEINNAEVNIESIRTKNAMYFSDSSGNMYVKENGKLNFEGTGAIKGGGVYGTLYVDATSSLNAICHKAPEGVSVGANTYGYNSRAEVLIDGEMNITVDEGSAINVQQTVTVGETGSLNCKCLASDTVYPLITVQYGSLYVLGSLTAETASPVNAVYVYAGNLQVYGSGSVSAKNNSNTPVGYAKATICSTYNISVEGSLSAENAGSGAAIATGGNYNLSYKEDSVVDPVGTTMKKSGSYKFLYDELGNVVTKFTVSGKALDAVESVTISGKPMAGLTLKVDEILPEGAASSVDFDWQYSDNPTTDFKSMYLGNLKGITLQDNHVGKYIRIRITGTGEYKGTVYSNVLGPVEANPANLKSVIFNGSTTTVSNTATAIYINVENAVSKADLTLVPSSSDAVITINGVEGAELKDADLAVGINWFNVTVSCEGLTKDYSILVTRKDLPKYSIGLKASVLPEGYTLEVRNEANNLYSETSNENSRISASVEINKDYTVKVKGSNEVYGIWAVKKNGVIEPLDGNGEVKGTCTAAVDYTIDADCYYVKGVTNLKAAWDADGSDKVTVSFDYPGGEVPTPLSYLDYYYGEVKVICYNASTGAMIDSVVTPDTSVHFANLDPKGSYDFTVEYAGDSSHRVYPVGLPDEFKAIVRTSVGTKPLVNIESVEVSGKLRAGNKLSVTNLKPAGATAEYEWQISDNAESGFTALGAEGEELTLLDEYVGKYIRVKARGTDRYSGEYFTEAVGPVKEDGSKLKSFTVNGEKTEVKDAKSFTVNVDNKTTEVKITAETYAEDAVVAINGTNGFEATVGNLVVGDNVVKIAVTFEGRSNEYTVTVNRAEPPKYDIKVKADVLPSNIVVRIASGSKTTNLNSVSAETTLQITENEEYTVSVSDSSVAYGVWAVKADGVIVPFEKGDSTTFKSTKNTVYTFDADCFYVQSLGNIKATWGSGLDDSVTVSITYPGGIKPAALSDAYNNDSIKFTCYETASGKEVKSVTTKDASVVFENLEYKLGYTFKAEYASSDSRPVYPEGLPESKKAVLQTSVANKPLLNLTKVEVEGTARVGSTLSVKSLLPENATANYSWQISSSSTTGFAATGETGSTLTLKDSYLGKYIRLAATGSDRYNKTVYSDVVGPVKEDGATLKAVSVNGNVLAADSDGAVFRTEVEYYVDEASIEIETYAEEAVVTIDGNKALTAKVGNLKVGDNTVKVSVEFEGRTNEYTVIVNKAELPKYDITVKSDVLPANYKLNLTDGTTTKSITAESKEETLKITKDEAYTVSVTGSNSEYGVWAIKVDGVLVPFGSTNSIEGTSSKNTVYTLDADCFYVYQVINIKAAWSREAFDDSVTVSFNYRKSNKPAALGDAYNCDQVKVTCYETATGKEVNSITTGDLSVVFENLDYNTKYKFTAEIVSGDLRPVYPEGLPESYKTPVSTTLGVKPRINLASVEIDGIARVGSTLSIKSLLPEKATADYEWQIASNSTSGFASTGETGKSITLKDSYLGKYIRLAAKGNDRFNNTVYSTVFGPVKEDGALLKAVTLNGNRTEAGDGFTTFNAYVAHDVTSADIKLETYAEEAVATIDGSETLTATVDDLKVGENTVKVTVSFDGRTNEYTIVIIRKEAPKYRIDIKSSVLPSGYELSAKDSVNSVKVNSVGATNGIDVVENETFTIKVTGSNAEFAVWAIKKDGVIVPLNGTELEGVATSAVSYELDADCFYVKSISNLKAEWKTGNSDSITVSFAYPNGKLPAALASGYNLSGVKISCYDASTGAFIDSMTTSGTSVVFENMNYKSSYKFVAEYVSEAGKNVYPAGLPAELKCNVYTTIGTKPLVALESVTINGRAMAGSTLSVNTVAPSGATASYNWMVSDNATSGFTAINGATGASFTLTDAYVGKYIRVKATGNDRYSGTVYSEIAGPVKADATKLKYFTVNGKKTEVADGETAFTVNVANSVTEAAVEIETYSTDSVITINGTEASSTTIKNLAVGENIVKVILSADGRNKEYTITVVRAEIPKYRISVNPSALPDGYTLNVTDGINSASSGSVNAEDSITVADNTAFTVSVTGSNAEFGVWAVKRGDVLIPLGSGNSVEQNVPGSDVSYTVDADCFYVKALSKLDAAWSTGSDDTITVSITYPNGKMPVAIGAAYDYSGVKISCYNAKTGKTVDSITTKDSNVEFKNLDYTSGYRFTAEYVSGDSLLVYPATLPEELKANAEVTIGSKPLVNLEKVTISGTAMAGSTLSVAGIVPADATVKYDWQISDNATTGFTSLGISSETVSVADEYVGKYIRVTATGTGRYTSTVVSAVAGPVAEDATKLKAFTINGNKTEVAADSYSFDVNVANSVKDANVEIETYSADSKVTINGQSGASTTVKDLFVGVNTVTISISFEGRSRNYVINIFRAETPKHSILVNASALPEGYELTVTDGTNEDGIKAVGEAAIKVEEDTEYTVNVTGSNAEFGVWAVKENGVIVPLGMSSTVKGISAVDMEYTLDADCFYVKPVSGLTAAWGKGTDDSITVSFAYPAGKMPVALDSTYNYGAVKVTCFSADGTEVKSLNTTGTSVVFENMDSKSAYTFTAEYVSGDERPVYPEGLPEELKGDVKAAIDAKPLNPLTNVSLIGSAMVGGKLSVSGLKPAGATADYEWQISEDGVTGFTVVGANKDTIDITEEFIGKYIRVKATGKDRYDGVVYSAVAGPVEADARKIKSFTVNEEKTEVTDDTKAFDVYVNNDVTEVTLTIEAYSTESLVYINGAEGKTTVISNLHVGKNIVEAVVSYEGRITNYTFNIIRAEAPQYSISVTADVLPDGFDISVEDDVTVKTVKAENDSEALSIIENVLYSIKVGGSNDIYGVWAVKANGKLVPLGAGNSVDATATEDTVYSLDADCFYAKAVKGLKAEWAKDSFDSIKVSFAYPGEELPDTLSDEYNLSGVKVTCTNLKTGETVDEVTTETEVVFTQMDPGAEYEFTAEYASNDERPAYPAGLPEELKAVNKASLNANFKDFELLIYDENDRAVDFATLNLADESENVKVFTTNLPGAGFINAENIDVSDKNVADVVLTEAGSIKVTAKAEGSTYIVIATEIYSVKCAAQLRIDVYNNEIGGGEETSVPKVTKKTLKVNIYEKEATEDSSVRVYFEGDITDKVTGVEFADSSLNKYFVIEVKDDRTVAVKANPAYDFADPANAAEIKKIKSSYKTALKVYSAKNPNGSETIKLTISVSKKLPTVKAAAVKLNTFFADVTAPVVFTSKNGDVVKAELDSSKKVPEWLTYNAETNEVTVPGTGVKKSGKLYLKVWVEGYNAPVAVTVSVSAKKDAPKTKLSVTKITVPLHKEDFGTSVDLAIIGKDKNAAFESFDITELRTATADEIATLSKSKQKSYNAGLSYKVVNFDTQTGMFAIAAADDAADILPAGKIMLFAVVGGNDKQLLEYSVDVKVASKVTIKPSEKSVKLDLVAGIGVDSVSVDIISSAIGYNIGNYTGDSNSTLKIQIMDSKGKKELFNELDFTYKSRTITLRSNEATKPGTYKVVITDRDNVSCSFDVKAEAVMPKYKADTAELTISKDDRTEDGNPNKFNVTIAADKYANAKAEITITDSKKNDLTTFHTPLDIVYTKGDAENLKDVLQISLNELYSTYNEKYDISVVYRLEDYPEVATKPIKIKVIIPKQVKSNPTMKIKASGAIDPARTGSEVKLAYTIENASIDSINPTLYVTAKQGKNVATGDYIGANGDVSDWFTLSVADDNSFRVKINKESDAFKNDSFDQSLDFTATIRSTYSKNKTFDSNSVKLTFKEGKIVINPDSINVLLCKIDKFDRACVLFTIDDPTVSDLRGAMIYAKAGALTNYQIVEVCPGVYTFGFSNSASNKSLFKSETLKLELYFDGMKNASTVSKVMVYVDILNIL